MYFFYDLPYGAIITNECNLLDFCGADIISRYSDRSKIKVGKKIHLIDSDNGRLGLEILEGSKTVMTAEYIKAAEDKMIKSMIGE